jgi:hypothetical protein
MELRLRSRTTATQARPANCCAQCREFIFMPEWSEYLNERRARHLWACDACGYRFETIVVFPDS